MIQFCLNSHANSIHTPAEWIHQHQSGRAAAPLSHRRDGYGQGSAAAHRRQREEEGPGGLLIAQYCERDACGTSTIHNHWFVMCTTHSELLCL